MIEFIKKALSNSDDVSSNRIGFLLIIIYVGCLITTYIIISVKGLSWDLPVIGILNCYNVLILGILGAGIVTKNVGKYFENQKEDLLNQKDNLLNKGEQNNVN